MGGEYKWAALIVILYEVIEGSFNVFISKIEGFLAVLPGVETEECRLTISWSENVATLFKDTRLVSHNPIISKLVRVFILDRLIPVIGAIKRSRMHEK